MTEFQKGSVSIIFALAALIAFLLIAVYAAPDLRDDELALSHPAAARSSLLAAPEPVGLATPR